MNTKAIEKNWSEIQAKIKKKWGKLNLNEGELESLKADLSLLAGKVQKAYGSAKDIADREFEDFKKSVHSLITVEVSVTPPSATQLKASWVVTTEDSPAPAKKNK